MQPAPDDIPVLDESAWTRLARTHEERIDRVAGPHMQRRSRNRKDPVSDFLFEYYAFRHSRLRRWSPGIGTFLLGDAARERFDSPEYAVFPTRRGPATGLDPEAFPARLEASTRWILDLLRRTQDRPPQFGCSGLHEWAMVYRGDRPRHDWPPMRLSENDIAAVVEAGPLTCTHFDAFRFFTDAARSLNRHRPERADMPEMEQGGCLHVNMDIYRWATKRYPWVCSNLIADAFEFALEIRRVDMRASPYDVSELGLVPIRVETPDGRREYREFQTCFHERGQVLRARLIRAYEQLLAALDENGPFVAIRRGLS